MVTINFLNFSTKVAQSRENLIVLVLRATRNLTFEKFEQFQLSVLRLLQTFVKSLSTVKMILILCKNVNLGVRMQGSITYVPEYVGQNSFRKREIST